MSSFPTMLSGGSGGGHLCIFKEDYPKLLLDQLQILRGSSAIYDLDLSVQNSHFKVHKVVLAAASTFIKVSHRPTIFITTQNKGLLFLGVKGAAETDATAQGRPTSSGTGTALSAPKLLLISQP